MFMESGKRRTFKVLLYIIYSLVISIKLPNSHQNVQEMLLTFIKLL